MDVRFLSLQNFPCYCSDKPGWKTGPRAVWVFIFTVPGGQNLISQAVFFVRGKCPLRMFFCLFLEYYFHIYVLDFSENNTHRRDFHIRKILLVFPPSFLLYRIIVVFEAHPRKSRLCSVITSIDRASRCVSSFLSWGEFCSGKTMGDSALPVTLFSRVPLPPASSCYLLNSKVAVREAGTPVSSPKRTVSILGVG